ncbi:Flp1 family type IVb pilin [Globicatella sulfidifaciens]|uniref:Putative Flagellin Flp1-like domain-containing protein n=1 Tax=Globicatella sulfidifaciens TaxID=136093 RepID=A0A7X8C5N8_9LACT|nr:Flp1 family type IVb pilin [Globicatella sulfidifaciens]NLJ19343.1 hypothetical protein [Globicatella sulfidifaciens]
MLNYMYLKFMNFMKDEEGLGTLEIILIIVVLVGIALIFRETITEWVRKLLDNIGDGIDGLDVNNP